MQYSKDIYTENPADPDTSPISALWRRLQAPGTAIRAWIRIP